MSKDRIIQLHRGMRFEKGNGERYILAQTTQVSFALISLNDGNRWDNPSDETDLVRWLESGFRYLEVEYPKTGSIHAWVLVSHVDRSVSPSTRDLFEAHRPITSDKDT